MARLSKFTLSQSLARADLADLNLFVTVEKTRNFSKAARQHGLSPSAVSHAITNLEARLGMRLFNRTSRSVVPTEVGATFALRLRAAFQEITEALSDINQRRGRPIGKLRLNILSDSARIVMAKVLPDFIQRYPEMAVEVEVCNRAFDIVSAGFDAGVGYANTAPENFITIHIGRGLRWIAVAAPDYISVRPPIEVPSDLRVHECIKINIGAGSTCNWEFCRGDESVIVEVSGRLCVNETALGVELALTGVGVLYCLQFRVAEYLASGSLVNVLSDWALDTPPFRLYYPRGRQMAPGLAELISMLKAFH